MKKVLVPVASEEIDAVTMGFVREFSLNMGAQLCIVSVLPYSDFVSHPQLTEFIGLKSKAFKDVCDDTLGKVALQLSEAGITNYTTAILEGDPASEIIDYADNERCDLILIRTHGMGIAKRFRMGSVANKVVQHANVPVLVVK